MTKEKQQNTHLSNQTLEGAKEVRRREHTAIAREQGCSKAQIILQTREDTNQYKFPL